MFFMTMAAALRHPFASTGASSDTRDAVSIKREAIDDAQAQSTQQQAADVPAQPLEQRERVRARAEAGVDPAAHSRDTGRVVKTEARGDSDGDTGSSTESEEWDDADSRSPVRDEDDDGAADRPPPSRAPATPVALGKRRATTDSDSISDSVTSKRSGPAKRQCSPSELLKLNP